MVSLARVGGLCRAVFGVVAAILIASPFFFVHAIALIAVQNAKVKTLSKMVRLKSVSPNGLSAYGTPNPSVQYTPERKEEILRAYHERPSLRGLERTFGVARQTVAKWLKEKADSLPDTLPLAKTQPDDVLELDELWSFVESKKQMMDLDSFVSADTASDFLFYW